MNNWDGEILSAYISKIEAEIQRAKETGVAGDFTLETTSIPEWIFTQASVSNKVIQYVFRDSVVTLKRKKTKCPTCGVCS